MSKSGTLALRLKALSQKAKRRISSNSNLSRLNENAVRSAYARWAPVYDLVFRAPFHWGRKAAVSAINTRSSGHILEAGVGTGVSLSHYRRDLKISGIDLSEEMLAKARQRARKLQNVANLDVMDASDLSYDDNTFDVTVAMYVITVVPDPVRVMQELARVTKPGGEVILVNHFSTDTGLRAKVENFMEDYADRLGWNTVFRQDRILRAADLELVEEQNLPPFNLFTMLRFKKPL